MEMFWTDCLVIKTADDCPDLIFITLTINIPNGSKFQTKKLNDPNPESIKSVQPQVRQREDKVFLETVLPSKDGE